MSKVVTPQPMPTTGLPDRREMPGPPPPAEQKAGLSSDRPMNINPGRPPAKGNG